MFSVKGLLDSGCLDNVPSKYAYKRKSDECISFDEETIPIIDFSLLTSGTPEEHSKVIQDIGNACQEWGFFMVINHGVPKKVRDEMIESIESFFNLTEEEKQEYAGKEPIDPIRYGTSFNVTEDKALLWRDYLKILVHPHFVSPRNPAGFSKVLEEYCRKTREVANELLKGISKSLGLEENYIIKKTNVEMGSQMLVANLYPPCPQPDIAMGLPPHSDYGLITLLIQNGLQGLQVMHHGKWVPITPLLDSFIVNIGDHMEILTKGKYKSVVHRAVVNSKATRISIGTAHGPPLETVISPAEELSNPPAHLAIKFREYLELQQSRQLQGKSCLDSIRI
ncbi:2-oxoglutarate-dependent dioxygenase 19 [Ricinus communis]|uniref:Flavonol synthase/flavanone 3-hydroxylase, putative n=1 Tax=Ricinus communis TaxID=3988 RepID=B9RJR8_RICCO|nr:2-oxoglutarate-dependent dioxygenase 19 [Ricinus communis]EEF48570.1 Flavonol synthase/flavanone 3-hydroxylase, putative [Ricinus communis]|eukprot:XP_002513987.1 probable 2-oxoglutarate/Fe(II)-dependent dioxygenase [Ricinus communis]